MAQKASEREKLLRAEAVVLLRRLGYPKNYTHYEGVLSEVYGALASADNAGYTRGHSEGFSNGWQDHGREKGCNCS